MSLEQYRELQQRRDHIQRAHLGMESPEEDAILEEMDTVWWGLSDAERERLQSEPPGVDPRNTNTRGPT